MKKRQTLAHLKKYYIEKLDPSRSKTCIELFIHYKRKFLYIFEKIGTFYIFCRNAVILQY